MFDHALGADKLPNTDAFFYGDIPIAVFLRPTLRVASNVESRWDRRKCLEEAMKGREMLGRELYEAGVRDEGTIEGKVRQWAGEYDKADISFKDSRLTVFAVLQASFKK